jgi:outer membrane protein TolC
LRDKNIDGRRFGIANTQLGQDIAGFEAVLVAIGVQQRAIEAYNQWVGSGQQVVIYRELLDLAEERQAGLKRQVQLGAQPDIILVENEQNILRRQSLLVRAETDLARASNRLSLFWRDDRGKPLQPELAQLPGNLPDIRTNSAMDVVAIMDRRPDLKIIENNLNQARLKLQLDENELLPKFDVFAEFSNDFGALGEGGASRDGFETIVGLNFSVPLQRRGAKGRISESQAKIAGLARARQQVEESINNLVSDLDIAVDAAERLAEIARQEEIRAKKLAAGERRLFQVGASDFFLVNIREEAAANAAIRRLQAQFEVQKLHADQLAVAADTEALGLEAMGTGTIRIGE